MHLRVAELGGAGPGQLEIDRLRAGTLDLAHVKLACSRLTWSDGLLQCRRATLALGAGRREALTLDFSYAPRRGALDASITGADGERWALRLRRASISAQLHNARIEGLAALLPQVAAYRPAARVDGTVSWNTGGNAAALAADLQVSQLSFTDAGGDHAGEKISGRVKLDAKRAGASWRWRTQVDWDGGDAYFKPFYLAPAPRSLQAQGTLDDNNVAVDAARLDLAQTGTIDLAGSWDRRAGKLAALRFATGAIDLARAATTFVKPLLEQRLLPAVDMTGTAKATGEWDDRGLARLDVQLNDASASEQGGGFAVRHVDATVPWRRDAATVADIRCGGASFGRVPLGAFTLPLRMHGLSFALPKTEIPLLGSALVVDGLRLSRSDAGWRWQVGGSLYPVSLKPLTKALGLPAMAGAVTASIPRIRHSGSTIEMDGTLVIGVFGGYVEVKGLKVVDPLGPVPRLYADLDAHRIDLGLLTKTFSFGSITGYVDADVNGLELVRWRPQRFSARIESSPGSYRKRISQRAVQNISALGGEGAAAAIQRSLLRFFDTFGYSKLGLTCTLANGVCAMGGIEQAPHGYVIVKGGGIPSINVIGYNRYVDWDELLSRLKRITSGNAKPVIE